MTTALRFARFLLNVRLLFYLFKMSENGYLADRGWFRAFKEKRPVDKDGKPIPWITSSCTDFLTTRLSKNFDLLEFGSGYSTLFYSPRVKNVTAIESDQYWYENLKAKIKSGNINIELFFKTGSDYWTVLGELGKRFHVIVVDGDERFQSAKAAINYLYPEGVLILDNSLRPEYKSIYDLLAKEGFRYIDFWGLAPGSRKTNCTTIFYRSGNCIGI